jgi:hypothetical protein
MDPHQTQKHDTVEKSNPETREGLRGVLSGPGDLPESYHETSVVLLPVGPYLLHVSWEVTPVELEKAKDQLGDEYGRSRAILRCHDVTNLVFDGTNAHGFFDVRVDLSAKGRYVDLWGPEKSYFVELGFETEDGRFFPIARSNIAETPSAWPAPKADVDYMRVQGDYDLVEVVPVPVDAQPSHRAKRFTPYPAEQEPPSAVKGDRHFEMSHPSVAEGHPSRATVHEKPFGDDRMEAEKLNATAEMRNAEPAPDLLGSTEKSPKEKERPSHKTAERYCDLDLTEVSEKRFTSGLSSK